MRPFQQVISSSATDVSSEGFEPPKKVSITHNILLNIVPDVITNKRYIAL